MAGIYQRDNYAQLMQNALNSAYNRRAATQRERAERVKEIVNAGGDFAKVAGRTAEEWNVPDQYADNPDYRAARFDYILSGDRSGLDAFRQAEMQAEQARKQQEFTAAENALNRKFQAQENEKNREIQRQQHRLEKVSEKARLLRDIRDADALYSDIEKNPDKYGGKTAAAYDKAKALHSKDMAIDLARSSGLFTNEELMKFNGAVPEQNNDTPSSGAPLDDQLAAARANGWRVPMQLPKEGQAEGAEPKKEDEPKKEEESKKANFTEAAPEIARKFTEARNMADLEEANKMLENLDKPATKSKEYEDLIALKNKHTKRVKDGIESAARNKSMVSEASTHKFSSADLREALGANKMGGSATETAKIPFTYKHNGKEYTAEATAKKQGDNAVIIVNGKVVQTVPLFD